jgi:oligopeptide/dipeptide ABC transporter ATP-binding protein
VTVASNLNIATAANARVLAIEGLCLATRAAHLVQDLSFTIAAGEMVGLVGESGCGKSITALSIMRLLPEPQITISAGRIHFAGQDLAALPEREMMARRGRDIGMIFQEPMTSLNPVFPVGAQIAEPLLIHLKLSPAAARTRAGGLLERVGLAPASAFLDRYPHQLSGGQRQRVMIAMAISCEPKLLIADEPTTALDVTVQAQVLALINTLRRDLGLACLLITHDLGVISEVCDRAYVMYAGRIVEQGPVRTLLTTPRHRYTRALIDTIPARNPPKSRLPAIPGQVPIPGDRAAGCAFAQRCTASSPQCVTDCPSLVPTDHHSAACWNPC